MQKESPPSNVSTAKSGRVRRQDRLITDRGLNRVDSRMIWLGSPSGPYNTIPETGTLHTGKPLLFGPAIGAPIRTRSKPFSSTTTKAYLQHTRSCVSITRGTVKRITHGKTVTAQTVKIMRTAVVSLEHCRSRIATLPSINLFASTGHPRAKASTRS